MHFDAAVELGNKLRPKMMHFKKRRAARNGFVNIERSPDTQCRRAFERSDETGVAIKKVILVRPLRHLSRIQEEATRMRIQWSMKIDRNSQVHRRY